MKFKTKLKALAVALAMTAGSASAAIFDGSTGNGGLFLEVYDSVNPGTYIRDLGVRMDSFGTTERGTAGFTANVDTGAAAGVFANLGNGALVNGALTFSADSNLTSFLSTRSASNLVWEVFAVDSNGGGAADQIRLLYTTPNNDQTRVAQAGTLVSNGQILSGIGAVNNQLTSGATSINALIGSNQSMITTTPTDTAFATFLGSTIGGFAANVNTWSTAGADNFLTYATRSSTSTNAEYIAVTYGTAANPFPVKFATDGTLTFGTVTAVPEPGTWAMMVAGLLMVGGIARRRISV
ncbi:MAG: PEP-CTERM sorting domain-containing protein [Betaproteobacteria bacterium]